jgi:hypothetical protein
MITVAGNDTATIRKRAISACSKTHFPSTKMPILLYAFGSN